MLSRALSVSGPALRGRKVVEEGGAKPVWAREGWWAVFVCSRKRDGRPGVIGSTAGRLGDVPFGGQVAISAVGQNGHDGLAFPEPLGHLQRREDVGPAGHSAEEALLAGQTPGHVHGVLVGDPDDLIGYAPVQNVEEQSIGDSFDEGYRFFPSADPRRARWFHTDHRAVG